MKRVLVALLFAATVAGGSAAFANTLSPVSSKSLGTGTAVVPKCGSASWTLTPQYSADTLTVTGVIVDSISASCLTAGGVLTVVGSTSTLTATGSLTLSGSTTLPVTVPFSGTPSALPTISVNNLAASVRGV